MYDAFVCHLRIGAVFSVEIKNCRVVLPVSIPRAIDDPAFSVYLSDAVDQLSILRFQNRDFFEYRGPSGGGIQFLLFTYGAPRVSSGFIGLQLSQDEVRLQIFRHVIAPESLYSVGVCIYGVCKRGDQVIKHLAAD